MKCTSFVLFLLFFLNFHIIYCQIDVDDITMDSTVTFIAGDYKAGKIKEFFLGSHYREVWQAPVSAPVFDIRKSGLKVTKQGGSRQTINLRLEDDEGNEYVLRSIDKWPSRALPEKVRKTFVSDIIEDQTATGHPYGAFTIPPMASAIGINHTNPVLVYVPYDTAFGEFADVLANEPALFERRPDEDQSHVNSFNNPPNVVGTEKMLEHLQKDHNNSVDVILFARTRLFDMLINDWGRHEDQWRWGILDSDSGKFFQAIPRDRDHAYFKIDGLLPSIASKWVISNLVSFDHCFRDIKGLNKSAYDIDNALLPGLSKEEWIKQAEIIRYNLSDEIIEKAIQKLPPSVYELTGEELVAKLKSRREQLPEVAYLYYLILSEKVTITGSDMREIFEVNRLNNDSTEIKVYKVSEEGNINGLIFYRVYNRDETDEITLYGLDGDDVFQVKGQVKKGIRIRIKGGGGNDKITDTSCVRRGRLKTVIDDAKGFQEIAASPESKLK